MIQGSGLGSGVWGCMMWVESLSFGVEELGGEGGVIA